MFCFFQTFPLKSLTLSEMFTIANPMYPTETMILQEQDKIRNEIISGNTSRILEYLQKHLEIKAIIMRQQYKHPNFFYTGLLNDKDVISVSSLNAEEAIEADYLMMVYSFCCQQLLQALPYISVVRDQLLSNKQIDNSQVKTILNSMKIGYYQLQTFMYNAHTFTPNLGQKNDINIMELNPQFFQMYRLYYNITANLFQYLIEQDYQKQQQLCSYIYRNINEFKQKLGQDRMSNYFKVIQIYSQQIGYISIIKRYQKLIEKEEYITNKSMKKFSTMSFEILQFSQKIIKINQLFQGLNHDEDYLDSIKLISQTQHVPFAEKQLKIYTNVQKNNEVIDDDLNIFLEVQDLSYLENY